ncbi:MAG: GNAT family N-acetyltransferase [Fibrobacteres bacterium]|nr:GNAT family N-acetyltransferase [Fibrobacterota bacterium]
MNNISYRIVKSVPVEAIVSLYQDAEWWSECEKSREIIPKMIQGSFCFMVAEHNNEIVGMGRLISDGVSDGYIQDVTVRKNFRKLGIGRELILRLIQIAEENGIEWLGLIAEPGTKPFYENIGFKEMKNYVAMRKM